VAESGNELHLRTLGLRVDLDSEGFSSNVTILIDGEDLLSTGGYSGAMGWDADAILVAECPLLPVLTPRRVAVNRCACGEPGCGNNTPVIAEENGRVYWSDFRSFTGCFKGPVQFEDETDAEMINSLVFDDDGAVVVTDDGAEIWWAAHKLDLPDLVFDAGQYRAEITRALADRSWELREPETMQTVRILRRRFAADSSWLAGTPLKYEWIWPRFREPESIEVILRESPTKLPSLLFPRREGTPLIRADQITLFLRTHLVSEWPFE
jgi:hypothetical protein